MSRLRGTALFAAALLAATLPPAPHARAAGTPPPPRAVKAAADSGSRAPDSLAAGAPSAEARTAAEQRYAEGFALAGEATKDQAAGQPERARKKFSKARKLFDRATQLDPRYYQAWNMLGYCARQCGDLGVALDAYGKCLEIEPEYAEAHEYLGETHLKALNFDKAKAELEWLRSRKSALADSLAVKIARAEAGGDPWEGGGGWKAPATDSTGSGTK